MADHATSLRQTHQQMTDAITQALTQGNSKDFQKLMHEEEGKFIFQYTGMTKQSPLYAALYDLVTGDKVNAQTAPRLAERLHALLLDAERAIGPDALDTTVNLLNFSHPLEQCGRYHSETLHDLLQEEKPAAPHFAGVIKRFHLLSRADMIRGKVIYTDRLGGGGGHAPYKPFG